MSTCVTAYLIVVLAVSAYVVFLTKRQRQLCRLAERLQNRPSRQPAVRRAA